MNDNYTAYRSQSRKRIILGVAGFIMGASIATHGIVSDNSLSTLETIVGGLTAGAAGMYTIGERRKLKDYELYK